MLKEFARGVLTSLRDSTYRSPRLATSPAEVLTVESRVLAHLDESAKRARRGWAGDINRLFEQPEGIPALLVVDYRIQPRWEPPFFGHAVR